MATLYRIGEDVVKSYSQRVQGGKITIQEGILKAAQAANKYVRDLIWRNHSMGDEGVPYSCLVSYTVGVSYDDMKKKWYAKLPIRTLDNLQNNMGIYYVAPADCQDQPIIPLPPNFGGLWQGLGAYSIENKIGYIAERDRVYIQGTSVNEDYKLYIQVIPDNTALDPDEEVALPPDCEYEVIQMALQLLAPQMQTPTNPNTNING
jgi:hypothetical protein